MPSSFAERFPEIQDALEALEVELEALVKSEVRLIPQVGGYLVGRGGKRIRPATYFLVHRAFGDGSPAPLGIAAAVELIHTATLLHDDVVDGASVRRGAPSANHRYGNSASVLVGDYLYTLSSRLLVDSGRFPIVKIFADATNRMAEGEVHQLIGVRNADTTQDEYLEIIDKKTAALFGAATQAGALVGGADPDQAERLGRFGRDLGKAFQITDDLLDYEADEQLFGKKRGTDYLEGKFTLPVIAALEVADPPRRERIETLMLAEDKTAETFEELRGLIARFGGLEAARDRADAFVDAALEALDVLPAGPPRASLEQLARFAGRRSV